MWFSCKTMCYCWYHAGYCSFLLKKNPHCTGLKFLKLTERGLRSKEIIVDLHFESYSHVLCTC